MIKRALLLFTSCLALLGLCWLALPDRAQVNSNPSGGSLFSGANTWTGVQTFQGQLNNGGIAWQEQGINPAGLAGYDNCLGQNASLHYISCNLNNGAGPHPLMIPEGTFNSTGNVANLATPQVLIPAGNVKGGLYLIVCYIVETTAATTSSTLPACNANWTDADGSFSSTFALTSTQAANVAGTIGTTLAGNNLTNPVNALAGAQIFITTSGYASSGATVMAYAVHAAAIYIGN